MWRIKLAISSYFVIVGFIIGNWVARIPAVKEEHNLSDGLFGVILVTGILGALLCLPVVTPIIERYGSSAGTLYGALATLILVPIIGITEYGIALLIVGIMGLGFGMGMVDVSMNAQGTAYEMLSGTHSFGLFHASYAIGGFLGALLGGLLAQQNVSPIKNFVLVSLCCLPLSIGMYFFLIGKEKESDILKKFRVSEEVPSGNKDSHTLEERLLIAEDAVITGVITSASKQPNEASSRSGTLQLRLMCVIGFIASLGEGSINDWSTIYFVETLHSSQLMAAIGYAAFELSLAGGRLYSDHLLLVYPGRFMLQVAGLVSSLGLAMVVFAPSVAYLSVPIAISGFAVCGAGVSICSPLVTHIASRVDGRSPTDSIAQVTTCVYLAMMIGPPLMGGLSSLLAGLRWAFILVVVLLGIVSFVASWMQNEQPSATEHSETHSGMHTVQQADDKEQA